VDIRYLKHDEIDFQKWDRCIKKSVNGTIYGYSWFLNIVSEDWDALVDEKYETVMPLTCKQIAGIKIFIQPPYATNLGVYSINALNEAVVNAFANHIPRNIRYIKVNLNKFNKIASHFFRIKRGNVYELDLIRSYPKITSHYTEKVKKTLKVGTENQISVVAGMNSVDLISLYLKDKGLLWKLLFRQRIKKIRMLIASAVKYRVGQIYGAYTRENNLCAAGLFVWSHQKIFFLAFGIDKTGKKEHALEVLIDEFIKLHAEQNLTLRFEYTSQAKYSELYSGLGAKKYEFMKIRKYNFPFNL
jgi:hypothetical protein